MTLPRELKQCQEKFELWYRNKNTSRTMSWLYSYGSVEMFTNHTSKRYQLIVSVSQAAILCLFNEQEEITCADIKAQTSILEHVFKPAMMRFCDPKIKLLIKKVNKPIFGADEPIKINPRYTSNTIRVNLIPKGTLKKKVVGKTDEEKKIEEQVKKERTFVVQAHIVKVMKAQKQYKFLQLTTDVIRNISMFKADPSLVKEQI